MRKFILCISCVLGSLIWGEMALAGQGYQLQCQNPECRYTSKFNFGRGMNFGQITGYCKSCNDFVYVTWPIRERTPEGFSKKMLKGPDPAAQVYDPNTGQTMMLYACPKCSQLFTPIGSAESMKYCPRCGQQSAVLAKI